MDLSFTAAEQAFADEIRAWLETNLELPPGFDRSTTRSSGAGRGRRSSRPIAGSGSTGRPSTAAGAPRRWRSRSTTWSTRGRARSSRSTGSASTWPGRRCSRTAPRRRSSGGCPRSSTRARSGASCSASPRPARTSRRCAPERYRPPAAGTSRARRSGRATRSTPGGGSRSSAPTRRRRSTAGSRTSSSTWRRRASRSGRSCRSPARPSSTRCSSTVSFVPEDHLVGGLHEGWAVASTTLAHERGTAFPFKEQVVHEVFLDELYALAAERGAPRRRRGLRRARAVVRRAAHPAPAQLAHAVAARPRHRARTGVEPHQAGLDRHDPAPLGHRARRLSAPAHRSRGSGRGSGCGRRRRRSPAAPPRCSAASSATASSACPRLTPGPRRVQQGAAEDRAAAAAGDLVEAGGAEHVEHTGVGGRVRHATRSGVDGVALDHRGPDVRAWSTAAARRVPATPVPRYMRSM